MNYTSVKMQHFLLYAGNSMLTSLCATGGGLVFGLPAAYSIAMHKQRNVALFILIGRMIPGIALVVPFFIFFRSLNMVGTYPSIILVHTLITLPFIVWIMISHFEMFPQELEDAARTDGCSIPEAFIRIVLPLSLPGIASASILAFISSWNNYLFTSILSNERTKTLPVAISSFLSYAQTDWGGLMAAASIITLPVIFLAIFLQRYLIAGFISEAIKV